MRGSDLSRKNPPLFSCQVDPPPPHPRRPVTLSPLAPPLFSRPPPIIRFSLSPFLLVLWLCSEAGPTAPARDLLITGYSPSFPCLSLLIRIEGIASRAPLLTLSRPGATAQVNRPAPPPSRFSHAPDISSARQMIPRRKHDPPRAFFCLPNKKNSLNLQSQVVFLCLCLCFFFGFLLTPPSHCNARFHIGGVLKRWFFPKVFRVCPCVKGSPVPPFFLSRP